MSAPQQRLILKAVRGAVGWPFGVGGLRILVTVATPYLLVIGSARLVTSEWFLHFEYTRAGFPREPYGMTPGERKQYGVYCIRYMTNNEGVDYLGNLTLPFELCLEPGMPPPGKRPPDQKPGEPCRMFKDRELMHMQDVKAVSGALFTWFWGLGILTMLSAYLLFLVDPKQVCCALLRGSQATLGIMLAISCFAVVGFARLFRLFHKLFFTGASWIFSKWDTLIRLYPRQFWLDATLTIAFLTLSSALFILCLVRQPHQKKKIDHCEI